MGSTSVVGAIGMSMVTFTLLVMKPFIVETLDKCLTGTPVISLSLFRVAAENCAGIPCRIPVPTASVAWVLCPLPLL